MKLLIVLFALCFWQFSSAEEIFDSAEVLRPSDSSGTILTIEDAEVQEIENQALEIEQKTGQENQQEESELDEQEAIPLDISIADTIGIYDIENGGVDTSYWQGRTYENIYDILKNININTLSPAYNRGIRHIVLSKTSVPNPVNSANVGKIARLKVDLLIKSGRFDDAKKLIQKMPVDVKNKLFSRDLVKMALVDFDNNLACKTFNKQDEATKKQNFWIITELSCLAIAYDGSSEKQKEIINNKVNQIEGANIVLPDGIKELILYHVFDQEITEQLNIQLNYWTINLMRLIGVGIEIDESDLKDIYVKRGILFNVEIDAYTRLKIAEQMFINDALPNYKLYQVYNSLDPNLQIEKELDEQTGEATYPRTYQRYLEYKALLGLNDSEKVEYMIDLLSNENDYMEKVKLIRIFTPMLKNITPYSGRNAVSIAKMFYAIGEYEIASEWANQNETAMWFELSLMEQMNPTKQSIVFSQNYGVFEQFDSYSEQNAQNAQNAGLFDTIFGKADSPKAEKVQKIQKINHDPLAENIEKRRAWMNYEFENGKVKGVSGIRIGAVFSMLEAIGYKISDASWLQASQMSGYVQTKVLSAAKTKALKIYVKNAKDPIHILIVSRQFINLVELDDTEFAKIMNILYRAGFNDIVRDIMLERAILYL